MNKLSTIGLITELAWTEIGDPLQYQHHLEALPPPSDVRLANRLKELDETDTLSSLMIAYRFRPAPGFQNLLRRCEHKRPVLYATDTIAEFHHLLVGILVAYAASLQHLFSLADEHQHLADQQRAEEQRYAHKERCAAKHRQAEEQRQEERRLEERKREERQETLLKMMRDDASVVSVVARLLSCLLNSGALRCHLAVLLQARLSLPNIAHRSHYEDFAKGNGIQPVQVTRWGKNKGRKRDKNKAQGTDSGEGDGSEISDEEELDQYHGDLIDNGLTRTVLGWLKTFICHYSAEGILQHHCVKHLAKLNPGSDVEVSIIGVSGKKRTVSDWPTMQQSIISAISTHDPDQPPSYLDEVLQILERTIRDNARRTTHPTCVAFAKILEGCEAVKLQ
jgi:hypothetical protein